MKSKQKQLKDSRKTTNSAKLKNKNTKKMMKKPELLAPVGNFEMLQTAINAKADAIYFGITGINMRTGGKADFKIEDMKKIVKQAHDKKVKTYLTLNTIIFPNEEELVDKILTEAKKTGVDAIIAWDLLAIKKAREKKLEVHLSTQASVANYLALKEFYKLGVKRFVLARELKLNQIKQIIKKIKEEKIGVEIETFIHGAMCIAVSGRCFMSQITKCKSANRGECTQVCRRKYKIIDEEEGTELKIENNYVMSPKDLCAMPIIESIINLGINVLKIEGRARSPEYVKVVVESYRKAIDLHFEKKLTEKIKKELITNMEEVYNKGFETGFYNGVPQNAWAGIYGNKATTRKMYVGKVFNFYSKKNIVEIQIESTPITKKDSFYLIGKTTGVIKGKLKEFHVYKNEKKLAKKTAQKGEIITFELEKNIERRDIDGRDIEEKDIKDKRIKETKNIKESEKIKVRRGDKFYKIVSVKENEELVQR